MAIEQDISTIAQLHNIGSLSLETQPLKYSLKSEASSWKAQFAKNLHRQARRSSLSKLSRTLCACCTLQKRAS